MTNSGGEREPSARLLWFVLFAPFVVLAVSRFGYDWFPVQDHAVLDMRIRELLSGDLPVLGAFSRYGWSHPGPVWFYVLSPFRALFGVDGLLVGSVLLFGAGIATAALIVQRRFGTWVFLVSLPVMLVGLLSAGSFTLFVPWNPHLAFAWFAVMLVLCASAVFRRSTDLAPAVFVGSLLVQLHVGYAAVVVPVVALVVLILGHRFRNVLARYVAAFGRVRSVRLWLLATLLAWLPPLLEQLFNGREGNLWRIARFFVDGSEEGPASGYSFAVGTLGGALRRPLTVFGVRDEAFDPFNFHLLTESALWLVPLVVLLGLALGLSVHRRRWDLVRITAFSSGAVLAGVFALSRVVGDRWTYIFVWRYALVWFCVGTALCVTAAVLWNGRRLHGRRGAAALVWVFAAAFGVALVVAFIDDMQDEMHDFEGSAEMLAAQILEGTPPAGAVQLIRSGDYFDGVADGVLNAVDAEDWPVGVPPDLGFKFGDSKVVDSSKADHRWLVSETSWTTSQILNADNGEVVGFRTPLSDEEDERLQALQQSVHEQLLPQSPELAEAVGSSLIELFVDKEELEADEAELKDLANLNKKVEQSGICRCAVVSVPVDGGN